MTQAELYPLDVRTLSELKEIMSESARLIIDGHEFSGSVGRNFVWDLPGTDREVSVTISIRILPRQNGSTTEGTDLDQGNTEDDGGKRSAGQADGAETDVLHDDSAERTEGRAEEGRSVGVDKERRRTLFQSK